MEVSLQTKDGGKVAAVVITYNRKKLLVECLNALLAQTRPLEKIYVVDNDSNDGTLALLEDSRLLSQKSIEWYELGENLGCSGGFHFGVKKAHLDGYDWIWVMDDDVLPELNALEVLMASRVGNACLYSAYVVPGTVSFSEPINLATEGKGFKTYWKISEEIKGRMVEGAGAPPLGLLIPRNIVDAVGLPRDDVFIFGEYEYLDRVREAGFKVYYNMASVIWHPGHHYRFVKTPLNFMKLGRESIWIEYPLLCDKIWKEYYGIRNEIFFVTRSKSMRLRLKTRRLLFLGVDVMMKIYYGNRKMLRTVYLSKAVSDGIMGKMGKRVNPF